MTRVLLTFGGGQVCSKRIADHYQRIAGTRLYITMDLEAFG